MSAAGRIKNAIMAGALAAILVLPVTTILAPQTVGAAQTAADKACEKRLLSFPTWFRGLSKADAAGECIGIMSPDDPSLGATDDERLGNFIWRIVLNVIEIGLQLVGYIAAFFLIYGGFQFMTGGGNPTQIESARKTMLNAVIGLIISLASVALVNLIMGIIA